MNVSVNPMNPLVWIVGILALMVMIAVYLAVACGWAGMGLWKLGRYGYARWESSRNTYQARHR